MDSKKIKNIFNYLLFPFLCTLTSVYILFENKEEIYKQMAILPLLFLICYELFLRKTTHIFREFSLFYIVINSLRYILLPLLITINGGYTGRSSIGPSSHSYTMAYLLMCYEIIICSISIYILSKKIKRKKGQIKPSTPTLTRKWFLYLFIIISLIAILIEPTAVSSLSFIMPNENAYNYDDFNTLKQIVILLFTTSKNIIYIILIDGMQKKYNKNKNNLYIIISIVLVILNSSIYFGTNRFDFVLNLMASTIIFCVCYKKAKIIISIVAITICLIGIVNISQIRNYRSASRGTNIIYDATDTLQIYLGGPYNIAMSIETANAYPEGRTIGTALYDFTRSVLGVNIIVRRIEDTHLSSYYFNLRIFNRNHQSQIMPMIGEGYYLFGLFLSPLIEILFIYIAYLIRNLQIKSNNLLIVYFTTITLIRLAFINCQSANIQLNDLSFNLFLPIIIHLINGTLSSSNRNNSEIRKVINA